MLAQTPTVLHNLEENPNKKAPLTSRERWIRYEQSPQGQYTRMKNRLRAKIKRTKLLIALIEEELNAKENTSGNGRS